MMWLSEGSKAMEGEYTGEGNIAVGDGFEWVDILHAVDVLSIVDDGFRRGGTRMAGREI